MNRGDTRNKLETGREELERAFGEILMARKRFQHGCLFKRGKRTKVWVGRWWEERIGPDGQLQRVRRAEILGRVAPELRTRRQAQSVLSYRLRSLNSGKYTALATQRLSDFVREQWAPVVLPTLKHATQRSYKYFLKVHLVPTFGNLELSEITRERVQVLLNRKLGEGLAWQTVHHRGEPRGAAPEAAPG